MAPMPRASAWARSASQGRRADARRRGRRRRRRPRAGAGASRPCSATPRRARATRARADRTASNGQGPARRSPPSRPRGSPTPAPQRTARQGGSRPRCSGGCRRRCRAPGAKTRLASGHQRRGRADDHEPSQEGAQVQPVAMGERQRYADQREEDARHAVRQEPHRRGEGQERRDETKVGEVPGEVVDRHADQRQAPRAIDGVDAARAIVRAFVDSPACVHGAAASMSASSRMNSPSNSTGPVIST